MRRLYLSLLAVALLGSSGPAWGAVSDLTPYGDLWLAPDLLLHPGQPCDSQQVLVYVRGYVSTPCDSFLGAFQVPGQPITVRTLYYVDRTCLVGPSQFFAVPIGLGRLAAGNHGVVVRRVVVGMSGGNGTLDSTTTETTYNFSVSPDCPVPSPIPAVDLPYVDVAGTVPRHPFPDRPVTFTMAGHFQDGCGRLESAWVRDANHVSLTLAPYPPTPRPCTANLEPWHAEFPLGLAEMPAHPVAIDLTVRGTNGTWPPIPDRRYDGYFRFDVGSPCDTLPTPPLPYVRSIVVGPHRPYVDSPAPICPSDSIRVMISGLFPGPCCASTRIELLPSPIMGPMPEPPVVRVVVDHDIDVRCPCSEAPEPWTGIALLEPLPTRDYGLIVELLEKGGGRDSTLSSTMVPFRVASAESCGPPQCLQSRWEHHGPFGSCDAYVAPDQEGVVTLQLKSPVPLSGLQGRLHSWEPGLRITAIEAVGVAAGMHLNWAREPDGARFVLYADQGAPIPANELRPILAVHALVVPMAHIPEDPMPPRPTVFHLGAFDLLGSDVNGQGFHDCPPPPWALVMPEVAVLCTERLCDFNQDGLNDVRDIVLMAHCAMGTGPCPPDAGSRFDCDENGVFEVPDVVCCAMSMLRGPGCPTCPIDSVRAEPEVAVRFGAPLRTAGGVRVPLMIDGADRIGAARLRLRFPAERFTARVVGMGPGLYLQDVEGDVLRFGLIQVLPGPVYAKGGHALIVDPGPLAVEFTLRPGASPGGELRLLDGQLSGPDGVLLGVDLDVPTASLGGEGVALSAPWPNPSTGTTRFTVSLGSAAKLEVAVHDISGRRVTMVFSGNRDAGLHAFSWDGRRDDGMEAPNGVYFLHLRVDGQASRRKVVLMRGPGVSPLR